MPRSYAELVNRHNGNQVLPFPVDVPHNFSEEEVLRLLEAQGYTRIHARHGKTLEVVQDRFRLANAERARVIEALEAALRVGQGRVAIYPLGEDGATATPMVGKKRSEPIASSMP